MINEIKEESFSFGVYCAIASAKFSLVKVWRVYLFSLYCELLCVWLFHPCNCHSQSVPRQDEAEISIHISLHLRGTSRTEDMLSLVKLSDCKKWKTIIVGCLYPGDMWNNWRQVPTWVCRSQPSPCQICFSLAQFRGWGGRDGLPFRTLFSNFNLHIIRGALPSSFQSIRPCITGKMQPKLLQSPLSQPKLKFAMRFFWFAANRLKSPFLSDPGPIIVCACH